MKKQQLRLVALLALSPLLSCETAAVDSNGNGDTDTDTDGDSDADGDTDTDADTDTDGDTDTDTDADDCEEYPEDGDGDGIRDVQEGSAASTDTDLDGTPDYQDDDSDGDGIPDAAEAGDDDPCTSPVDTDGDGRADFRDADSDDDGIPDGVEDADHDGVVDAGETDPQNADTDGDGASDLVEQYTGNDPLDPEDNPEADGNFVFLVPYQKPAEPPSGILRFRTNISMVDLYFLEDISGSMGEENAAIRQNMVAVLNDLTCIAGETAASCSTDCAADCGDDLCGPGEDPGSCPYDCLGECGDGYCIGSETASTCPGDCPGEMCGGALCCGDGTCDGEESPASCPSDCAGTCGDGVCAAGEQASITGCIQDLWSGAGVYGTTDMSAPCGTDAAECDPDKNGTFTYQNLVNIQADPAVTQAAVPDQCWGNSCNEPALAALFYTVSGHGTAEAEALGYTVPALDVPAPAECTFPGVVGYPCFRRNALPIVLVISDVPFSGAYLPEAAYTNPPSFPVTSGAVSAIGARVVGITGSADDPSVIEQLEGDLAALCEETESLSASGQPYIFSGADTDAAGAIADGISALASSLPLDMSSSAEDDESDAVDAVAEFIDFLDTHAPGTAECASWSDFADGDGDSHDDTFVDVTAGTPVCWEVHAKDNTTVPPDEEAPLMFKAYVELLGDGVTLLDTRTVYFIVPPDVSKPVGVD